MNVHFFHKLSDVITNMQNSRKVYIYGGGELGQAIKRYLRRMQIQVMGYAVDTVYYNRMIAEVGEQTRDFVDLEELLALHGADEDFYLIWGIASPGKLRQAIKDSHIPNVWLTYEADDFWIDHDFAHKNIEMFENTKSLLADETSKKTMDAYLAVYAYDYWGDIETAVDGTYYNELTKNDREGCLLDCGAFIGDSADAYVKAYGMHRKIYSFEPDEENFRRLQENTKELNITCINAGCWSKSAKLCFDAEGNGSARISEDGKDTIDVVAVDDVIADETVAFVKMDVEGSELEALAGMKNILQRDMPVLAISAYHKQEDLITLPQYIRQFESEKEYYKLYLRHHGCATTAELVLYAIPTRKQL